MPPTLPNCKVMPVILYDIVKPIKHNSVLFECSVQAVGTFRNEFRNPVWHIDLVPWNWPTQHWFLCRRRRWRTIFRIDFYGFDCWGRWLADNATRWCGTGRNRASSANNASSAATANAPQTSPLHADCRLKWLQVQCNVLCWSKALLHLLLLL